MYQLIQKNLFLLKLVFKTTSTHDYFTIFLQIKATPALLTRPTVNVVHCVAVVETDSWVLHTVTVTVRRAVHVMRASSWMIMVTVYQYRTARVMIHFIQTIQLKTKMKCLLEAALTGM